MEDTKPTEKTSEKKSSSAKRKNVLKKLDLEAAKQLATLKDRANKKSHGRKVRDGEIIAKALSLVSAEHILELQEAALSEKDRLHMAHEEFVKQNGKITLDQFIGRLLKGDIKTATP